MRSTPLHQRGIGFASSTKQSKREPTTLVCGMLSVVLIRTRAAFAVCLGVIATAVSAAPNDQSTGTTAAAWHPTYNRENWPAALRDVPIERLSSGALLRLDQRGDLVEPMTSVDLRRQSILSSESRSQAAVALDPRVGSNIRLGDDPAALPSTQRAQAEPHIARAPNAPDFLLATFQEGRYTDGGAIDCGYSTSHNGGLSWSRALIPQLTPARGGSYPRATDPVAAIDLNGNAYLNTLGFNGGFGAVLVSRSSDGGKTFKAPVLAYQSATSDDFPDKNWLAVNTFGPNPGRLIETFTLFSNTAGVTRSPIMRVLSDDGAERGAGPRTSTRRTMRCKDPNRCFCQTTGWRSCIGILISRTTAAMTFSSASSRTMAA